MDNLDNLDALGLRFGTDKASDKHGFLRLYERRLAHLKAKGQFLVFMEIGVYRGESLAMWSEYFPQATIIGLDISPECKRYEGGNKRVRIGDQSDTSFLDAVLDEFGVPHVILDDGSHRWAHQIATMRHLFPKLGAGGIYIVEDIDTSFPGYLVHGHDYARGAHVSAYDYIAKLTRLVTGGGLAINEEFDEFCRAHAPSIESIEFASQTVLIGKKTARSIARRYEHQLVYEGLEALSLPSARATVFSAWHGHVAFAHWIVWALKPRVVVELGTHYGVSYAAFCAAVRHFRVGAKCFAIDTWEGDEHSGAYTNEVYESVLRFNTRSFADFSSLLRMRFDEALVHFEDGSVDLLHIDGLHTYEAVRHDFETWMPKLSNRAVVLFHDTCVMHSGFGVYRLWDELSRKFPHFAFEHSAGLGVLVVGRDLPENILDLCSLSDREQKIVRQRFEEFSVSARDTGRDQTLHGLSDTKGVNIALNCAAFQSSFYVTPAPTPQGAVNGIKTGTFGFHTWVEDRPWWKVDLGEQRTFDAVRIFNRLDLYCAARAASLEIEVSNDDARWSVIYLHDGSSFGGIDEDPLFVEVPGTKARFVKISLRSRNFLHLDEVEIIKYQEEDLT
jgi:cephalosporin hydroxylase